ATIPETEPSFKQYTLRGIAFAGLTRVSNRLLDAPGFETTLRQMMSEAMSAYLDYFFIRGDGTGKPLGVLNAPARVNVTRNAGGQPFEPEDAIQMYARFKTVGNGTATWLIHPSVVPSLTLFSLANTPVWAPNWREGVAGTLLGIPVVVTEYCSLAGTAGDVILVDWAAYAVQLGNEVEIAVSEHAYFTHDQTAFRVIAYADGQPRIQDRAKLIGTNYEVSPFVVLQ
ncbi:MAG: phage major capsid protein, partial [Thermoflexales bacterium]|nr:phage major capsid protein [Thermoflexales bacterium]